jgi:Domain of unknown function (DUF4129)
LRRTVIAVATVVVLLVVVGASARRPLGGGAAAPSLPLWPLLVVVGAGLVLGASLTVAMLPLGRDPRERARRVRPGPLTIALSILVPVAILAAFIQPVRLNGQGLPNRGKVGTHEPRQPTPAKPGGEQGNGAAALAAGIAAGIVGVAAVGVVAARRRRRRPGLTARAAVAAGARDAIEDIAIPADPRAAVLAAYARMEAALAQVDLGRRASEAPREYLARFEAGLGGGRGPAERLTTLFERARFSPHAIDEPLRADALAALSALRAELEAAP